MASTDAKKAIAVLSILTGITTILVGLRLRTRKTKKAIGADDWALMLALILIYVNDGLAFTRGFNYFLVL